MKVTFKQIQKTIDRWIETRYSSIEELEAPEAEPEFRGTCSLVAGMEELFAAGFSKAKVAERFLELMELHGEERR